MNETNIYTKTVIAFLVLIISSSLVGKSDLQHPSHLYRQCGLWRYRLLQESRYPAPNMDARGEGFAARTSTS